MVVVSLLPHAEIGPNEQREDSFHFSQNQASVILFVNELGVLPRIRVRNHEKFVHEITIKSQSCTKSRLNLNRARLANKMHEESCTKDDWILSTISNPAQDLEFQYTDRDETLGVFRVRYRMEKANFRF